ncbi:hypothetical protein FJT64_016674 [Amphibalanus amphitrite]|uniref:SWIM-type domain-containing protein n=1 Tax=Amphibalanus amphitrite TaxID=1232801 RepID=A0A6A4X507_AMPAM|nr:hypothetical protein FJT64_016674 [Amphibalanus amphitrite]
MCTCPGYVGGGRCKHLDAVKALDSGTADNSATADTASVEDRKLMYFVATEDAAPSPEPADGGGASDSGDDFTSRPPVALASSSRVTAPDPLEEVRQSLAAFSEAVSAAVLEDTAAHPDQGPSWQKALNAFVADWRKGATPTARQSQLYAQRHLGKARYATTIPVLRPEPYMPPAPVDDLGQRRMANELLEATSERKVELLRSTFAFRRNYLVKGRNTMARYAERPYARAAEILGMTKSGVKTLVKRQRTSGAAPQQPTPATTIDNFTIGAIRRHVYARFANKEFLTVERLLDGLTADGILRPDTSESTLRRILHQMGFRYRSTQRKMCVRKEKSDIVCRRIQALRKLKQHRENGHQIVYVDETWFTTRMCHSREWVDNTQTATSATYSRQVPPGDGERFIVVAAGSEEGTIDGSFLSFVSKNRSGDYHGEMNSELFIRWLTSHLLPSLSRPAALVLDNAPYHSVLTEESRCPTSATRKADLINWLTQRDIQRGSVKFVIGFQLN